MTRKVVSGIVFLNEVRGTILCEGPCESCACDDYCGFDCHSDCGCDDHCSCEDTCSCDDYCRED